MREEFIEKTFRSESLKIIDIANVICTDYARQGYDLSLRQLYYQFVARGLLENSDRSYERLGRIISDGRLAGLIDWDHIKDRGRKEEKNNHWETPSDIIEVCAEKFRIDLWADQDHFVFVMVEKQALEGVLLPVCKKLDVSFVANKGYSSSSMMYEIGKKMYEKWQDNNRMPVVIYLGDHDPSGIDMTRDVEDRLSMFSYVHPSEFIIDRIALNMDQVQEHKPPPNPAKLTDSRASEYIARYGSKSWELDALEPSLLADLVVNAVGEYRDDYRFEKRTELQDAGREQLRKISENIKTK